MPAFDAPPDFTLTMPTWAAYHGHVAHKVTEELRRRFGLPADLSVHVITCLQEACMNALVHGNLEVARPAQAMESFDAHWALIETRLNREPYQSRRLTVEGWNIAGELTLAVSDEGKGIMPELSDDPLPEGRGLYIIGSLADRVWIGSGRRTLFMSFRCPR